MHSVMSIAPPAAPLSRSLSLLSLCVCLCVLAGWRFSLALSLSVCRLSASCVSVSECASGPSGKHIEARQRPHSHHPGVCLFVDNTLWPHQQARHTSWTDEHSNGADTLTRQHAHTNVCVSVCLCV
mmetsp:Transcript_30177/g.87673  ORF Transcript_30177/g.87673 Transcript_30177/m.87673 type:complete len:126 (-) Transcript_30177:240-617(-)